MFEATLISNHGHGQFHWLKGQGHDQQGLVYSSKKKVERTIDLNRPIFSNCIFTEYHFTTNDSARLL